METGTIYPFLDSDVYKWLEAVAWELGREVDPDLTTNAQEAIAAVAAAQRPDGYLNSYVQVVRPGSEYDDLAWGHELYCIGHLIQAGIAWQRALGDGRLLDIAVRAADSPSAPWTPAGGRISRSSGHRDGPGRAVPGPPASGATLTRRREWSIRAAMASWGRADSVPPTGRITRRSATRRRSRAMRSASSTSIAERSMWQPSSATAPSSTPSAGAG